MHSERQGEGIDQIQRATGNRTTAQIFHFLDISMSEHFSNMLVKYQFILTNLTAGNNRFSFRNFQQPLYEGISTIGYFQPSTLTWLVCTSSSQILSLQGLIQELLPPCIFDVARQRVLCLKRQGKAVVQIWGEGGRQPLFKFFNF